MTTFTTFNVNDMVFMEGLGYGTLLECGSLKSIAIKEPPALIEKRESIYFDPELFNSDSEPLTRQKSESAVLVINPKVQSKENQVIMQTVTTADKKQDSSKDNEKVLDRTPQKKLNIVKIRLEGTNALVYTLDSNIRKYVIVPVKPLFLPALGTLNIKIQIGKTIESFKKQILDLVGLKQSQYFNLKLFTTSPCLSQFNCPGKTVWQYGIRENSILTMTAQHGFCFENVPSELAEFFSVVNNGLTFLSLPRKSKPLSTAVIALPPIPSVKSSPNSNIEDAQGQNSEKIEKKQAVVEKQKEVIAIKEGNRESTQDGVQINEEVKSKEQKLTKQDEKIKSEPPESLRLCGDKLLRSGKHYFEVRLDKLPQNNSHMKIGISEVVEGRRWLFSPLTMQKMQEEGAETKLVEPYGMTFKQNDVVGVLAKIDKHKCLKVTFFKNGVNLGHCFEGKMHDPKFIFEIGSEGQISLDSRAQPPLDSYRFR